MCTCPIEWTGKRCDISKLYVFRGQKLQKSTKVTDVLGQVWYDRKRNFHHPVIFERQLLFRLFTLLHIGFNLVILYSSSEMAKASLNCSGYLSTSNNCWEISRIMKKLSIKLFLATQQMSTEIICSYSIIFCLHLIHLRLPLKSLKTAWRTHALEGLFRFINAVCLKRRLMD